MANNDILRPIVDPLVADPCEFDRAIPVDCEGGGNTW